MSFNIFVSLAGSSESRAEREDTYSANRGMKRKAVDQGLKCASFHSHMMSTMT